jgi:phage baseplate assembly protein W
MSQYYGLPIKFSAVLNKQQLRRVDVMDSIGFNVRLILRSQFGENRFDSSYGCSVWERDFEIIESHPAWSQELSKSIRDTLLIHEKRMQNIQVEAQISEQEFKSGSGSSTFVRIKRKITVNISFNFYLTNERYTLVEVLYISPLSVEEAE